MHLRHDGVPIIVRTQAQPPAGGRIRLGLPLAHVHLFDTATGLRLDHTMGNA